MDGSLKFKLLRCDNSNLNGLLIHIGKRVVVLELVAGFCNDNVFSGVKYVLIFLFGVNFA